MNETIKQSRWLFIIFPALAMMLGWGLRGHIGGGPFGAMIPGAMVALSLSLLLKLPAVSASVIVVFGVIGIGLGGEMTYGQTLGFLREPGMVWWGNIGTTLKGAIWGLLGGAVFSLGFVYKKLSKKTVVMGFLLVLIGFFLGFRLINDPMVLYFSDPQNPRPESWAALLMGAITLLVYLKFKADVACFKIVIRFALWGMIGGGLGFGLGGLWIVLGSRLPGVIFGSWWKAMEFTFGFLLGASLGYAAWLNRKQLKTINKTKGKKTETTYASVFPELGLLLVIALLTHWLIPKSLEPFVFDASPDDGGMLTLLRAVARIVVNYAFYGLLFVLFIIRFPKITWQVGITLTFCHAAIDLIRDFFPDVNTWSPFTLHFLLVLLMTTVVALLTAYFSRKDQIIRNMFLLLVWSCIAVSFLRMGVHPERLSVEGLSLCEIICGKYFVDIFFTVSAIVVSILIVRKSSPTA